MEYMIVEAPTIRAFNLLLAEAQRAGWRMVPRAIDMGKGGSKIALMQRGTETLPTPDCSITIKEAVDEKESRY